MVMLFFALMIAANCYGVLSYDKIASGSRMSENYEDYSIFRRPSYYPSYSG